LTTARGDALDPPLLAQRRCMANRPARYFTDMLHGHHVLDAPRQWVWGVGDDSMAPAFPAGSNALFKRHKGELVAGGYYIFTPAAPASLLNWCPATCTPRRPAAWTPHRAYIEREQWRAYYRIVRHW
jgi:hypothetical protein